MNFLTIIGMASVNEEFREKLCSRGAAALEDCGLQFVLSQEEIDKLNSFRSDPALCGALKEVYRAFCREPPCPKALQYPCPKDVR